MHVLAIVVVGVVALLHLLFLILEMFLWTKPIGHRIFGLPRDVMTASASLAANQGLYNGFLAAGLVWALALGAQGYGVTIFFLLCVVIAGVFGAVTAKRSILYIQALPGAVALLLTMLAHS